MKVYTDGGSRGNPGKAACAFVVISKGKIIKQKSKFLKIKTNNEAEYNAIIFALENIKQKQFEIISDSELIIKQITGEYRINKSHLALLNQKVRGLISARKIKFSTVKRENKFISLADELVNKELDKY
tara:strand:+ start:257 stop:640 length:384 start_codon:yes stop_codon:yes gene_type:complete